jgi:hypothetical protein
MYDMYMTSQINLLKSDPNTSPKFDFKNGYYVEIAEYSYSPWPSNLKLMDEMICNWFRVRLDCFVFELMW